MDHRLPVRVSQMVVCGLVLGLCHLLAQPKVPESRELDEALKLLRKAEKKTKGSDLRQQLKHTADDLARLVSPKANVDRSSRNKFLWDAYTSLRESARSAPGESQALSELIQQTIAKLEPVVRSMEDAEFTAAHKKNSPEAYETFMAKFPGSHRAEQAEHARLTAADDSFWTVPGTATAYEDFLRKYPASKYAPVAQLALVSRPLSDAERAPILKVVKRVKVMLDQRTVNLHQGTPTGTGQNVRLKDIESVLRSSIEARGLQVLADGASDYDALLYAVYVEVGDTIRTGSVRAFGGRAVGDSWAFPTGVRFRYVLLHPRLGRVSGAETDVKPQHLQEEAAVTLERFRGGYVASFGDVLKADLFLK